MSLSKSTNLTAVAYRGSMGVRQHRFGHCGGVVWLTGLAASGKSTLAMALEHRLVGMGYACYMLDGANIRDGLNSNLGFSPEDRAENILRVGEVVALFADAGMICITAFISPYRKDRAWASAAARYSNFHEVHIAANLAACEERDPKGMYRKARAGELREFTGVDAPYEAPDQAELVIDSGVEGVGQSLARLVAYVIIRLPLAS